MDKLRLAYIQPDLIWENSGANLQKFEKVFNELTEVDLVILPEMFNTGFTMNTKGVAENMQGRVVNWMKQIALENNYGLIGSAIIKEGEDYFNRCFMALPCSNVKYADKRHLFRMGGEHKNFSPGTRPTVVDFFGWRIRPLVCYDLRFPVWSRNRNNYDLLVYVANWPAPRRDVWLTLLKARAIENQCYVVGVNRVGEDGMGIQYTGDSMVIDPKGNIISSIEGEGVGYADISLQELNQFREKFPVHLDADDFELDIK